MPGDQQALALAAFALASGDGDRTEGHFHLVSLDRGGRKFIGGLPMKPATKQVDRVGVELARCRELLEDPALEHRDPVAERHRLGLVVGDVDRGDPEPPLQAGDLGAHLAAQLGVEVGQRLVEQERLGVRTIARPIATRWRWPPERLPGLRSRCSSSSSVLEASRTFLSTSSFGAPAQPEREGDVLVDRQVRVERVVLEHHREVAVARSEVVDLLAADDHVARR
jgi:hypothetical protein